MKRLFRPPPAVKAAPLIPLEGSPKQVAWAEEVRRKALAAVAAHLVDLKRMAEHWERVGNREKADDWHDRLERSLVGAQALAQEPRAHWWIDRRNAKPEGFLRAALIQLAGPPAGVDP